MNPENETKDARIPVAVPQSVKAWVRDRARIMGIDSSKLVFNWIMERLYTEEGIRTLPDGIPEFMEALSAHEASIHALRARYTNLFLGIKKPRATKGREEDHAPISMAERRKNLSNT